MTVGFIIRPMNTNQTNPQVQYAPQPAQAPLNPQPHKAGIPRWLRSIISLLVMVLIIVGLSWGLRTYVFQAYEIPSGSMEETIQIGDMIFSEKLTYYSRSPEPGDIVTFADPEKPGRTLIKRCIAVAGQTVDINESGTLYIDGVAQSESYTNDKLTLPLNSDITYPYTVPDGCIWVMGDNRTNSQDSRYFGAVKVSTVTGRAVVTYWPIDHIGVLK